MSDVVKRHIAFLVATLAIGGAVSACTREELAAADRFEAIWTGAPPAKQVALPALVDETPAPVIEMVAELPAAPVEPEPIIEDVCVPVFRVKECP